MEKKREWIKRMALPRHALLWIFIAAVWIFIILKVLVGAFFEKNTSLVSAFSVSGPGVLSATVEVTARFPEEYLDSFDKQQMLKRLAKGIGLTITEKPELEATENRQELSYRKNAYAADTELRIISLKEETEGGEEIRHYLYAKITLRESIEAILTYKKLLEETFTSLKGTDISTTIQLMGEYSGYLTMEKKNEVTDRILSALDAKVAYDHREADLYTVYAYTAALENYITVENKKINLHIAMSRDEENYRTLLYLATPILPDTW